MSRASGDQKTPEDRFLPHVAPAIIGPSGVQQPRDNQRIELSPLRGGVRSNARVNASLKAAGRIEAVSVPDSFPFFAMTNVSEREAQAACALISVERDSVMAQEPASHPERIEIRTTKIFVLPTPCRLLLDASEKLLEPLRRLRPPAPSADIACKADNPAETASPIEG